MLLYLESDIESFWERYLIMNVHVKPDSNRVVVVGLGRHGLGVIQHLATNSKHWTVAGVIDPSAAAYARFQSHFHSLYIPCYKTLEAIEELKPDLVLVATTAPFHVRVTRELIQRGYSKSIMIEKPVSTSVSEAQSLQDILERWDGTIGVDFNRRCSPLYQPLHQLIAANSIGRLKHIQYNNRSKISMKGSHFIDLALWTVTAPPVQVSARLGEFSTVDPRGAAFFDPEGCIDVVFADGTTFQLDATGSNLDYQSGMTWVFEHGIAHVNSDETTLCLSVPNMPAQLLARDESNRFQWIENAMDALAAPNSLYATCSIREAIVGLGILTGAFISNSNQNRSIGLPLDAAYCDIQLRVA